MTYDEGEGPDLLMFPHSLDLRHLFPQSSIHHKAALLLLPLHTSAQLVRDTSLTHTTDTDSVSFRSCKELSATRVVADLSREGTKEDKRITKQRYVDASD